MLPVTTARIQLNANFEDAKDGEHEIEGTPSRETVVVCLTAILLMASHIVLERMAVSVSRFVSDGLTSNQLDLATINAMLIVCSDRVAPQWAFDYTP